MAAFPAEEFRIDGDPGAIRSSAAAWNRFGTEASEAAAQIRSLDTSLFIGPEGDQYREGLNNKLPPHLDVAGDAYSKVGGALTSYTETLSSLQDRMRPLATRAPGLWQDLQAAQGRVTSAVAADRRHALQVQADALARPQDETAPPDTYQSDAATASAALSQIQRAWNECLTAARQVKAELRAAVDSTARIIHEAADSRFEHNPSGFGALVAGVKDFVKDHAAGLAKLSGALKLVSGIAGVLSFVPVIGEAALAVSLVTAGAALLIDGSIKLATGKGSWTAIMVDGALIAVPFGVGRAVRGLRGANGAKGLVEAGDGVIRFRPPPGATPEEIAQVQRYVDAAERARLEGRLSKTGRVSTDGELRLEASKAARREKLRAAEAGTPYDGHAGHAPDTTWIGKPEAYEWHDQTRKVNSSLGGQVRKYPVGFKPSEFVFDSSPAGE